jgi:hypothetical protein
MNTWKFDQPPNCAVITLKSIIARGSPVLHVTHDEDDHGWQFLGWDSPREEDAAVTLLQGMLKLDPTLEELHDLPPGWRAWRKSKDDAWNRERRPTE